MKCLRDNTGIKVLTLHAVDVGSMSNTAYSPQKHESDLWAQSYVSILSVSNVANKPK